MAVDKIAKSFLILFFVECIVRYGSCSPIQENIVLDNGTVLTMVIHDVVEAPPPRSDSALDADSSDKDNKPVIVIHEAQYAPAPHIISKRRADPDNDGHPNLEVKISDPIHPPTPRAESDTDLVKINTPGVPVKDGAQTEKVLDVQAKGSGEKWVTEKVSEPLKSTALQGSVDDASDDKAKNETKEKDDKVQGRTTPVAVPTQQLINTAVDGDSKDGNTKEGASDENVIDENSPDDQSEDHNAKVSDGKNRDSTPSGESLNQKSSTENIDYDSNDENEDEESFKLSVNTPADESNDDELTGNDGGDDQHTDDDNSRKTDDDDKNSEYYDEDEDDRKDEENATSDVTEDEDGNEEDDEDKEMDETYSRGRPASSGEINDSDGSSTLKKGVSESQSSGHFMSYFLIAVVFVACFYLVFHNRQKIKAYILEGKTGRGRKRKAGNSEYRPLSSAEEVLPSADKGIESKIAYTY